MQYSVVRLKDVFEDNEVFRFDAGYYYPPAYNLFKKVKSLKFSRIKECFTVTKLAGFEYTDYFTSKNVSSDDYYIVLTSKNIQHEELVLDDYLRIDKKTADQYLNRSRIKKGDIVLSYTGEYRRALVIQNDGFQLGPNICLIRQKEKTLNPYYVSTFLNANAGQLLLDREKTLSAQPTVAMSRIREIPIPLLSEIFQSRIEKIILESKRNQLYANDLYRQAEQILLSELGLLDWMPKHQLSFVKNFLDTKSADRMNADYFQPMYHELIERIKQYENGCKKLDDLVSIKKCIEPGSEVYQENGIPFLRVSNLSKLGINNDNQQYISEGLYEKLKNYQPQKGEILLSKDATPGIAFYLNSEPEKMIPSGGILRLKVKDVKAIYPEYLTLVLNSVVVQRQIDRDIGGSVINHWLVDQIKNALIPVLPGSIQKDISDKIADSFLKREQSKKLLDIAKRAVEMAIEQNEEGAEKWLNEKVGS